MSLCKLSSVFGTLRGEVGVGKGSSIVEGSSGEEMIRQAAGNMGDRLLHLPWEDRGPDRQRESAGLQKHNQVTEKQRKARRQLQGCKPGTGLKLKTLGRLRQRNS